MEFRISTPPRRPCPVVGYKLSALLYVDGADDFGPDDTVRAVIGGNGG